MSYADPTSDTPVQIQQGGKVLALGSGATLGADAGALIDLSGVPAGSVLESVQEGLTAKAGGGASGATAITAEMARFTTVATGGDSGLLPVAKAGVTLTVINAGAASLNVFPDQTAPDTINALSAGAAFALAAGKTASFFCTKNGQWHTILSA